MGVAATEAPRQGAGQYEHERLVFPEDERRRAFVRCSPWATPGLCACRINLAVRGVPITDMNNRAVIIASLQAVQEIQDLFDLTVCPCWDALMATL
ncbi:MAG: hypothetical protein DMG57_29195 [Acidobacteria bacterium]|nr:MAG: hypothetical protein DMG57_29195 [Acidobacteriota bacterium]